jgi:hypothetical protein
MSSVAHSIPSRMTHNIAALYGAPMTPCIGRSSLSKSRVCRSACRGTVAQRLGCRRRPAERP